MVALTTSQMSPCLIHALSLACRLGRGGGGRVAAQQLPSALREMAGVAAGGQMFSPASLNGTAVRRAAVCNTHRQYAAPCTAGNRLAPPHHRSPSYSARGTDRWSSQTCPPIAWSQSAHRIPTGRWGHQCDAPLQGGQGRSRAWQPVAECEVLVRRLDNAALRRERQLGRGWKLVPAPGLEEKGVQGGGGVSRNDIT